MKKIICILLITSVLLFVGYKKNKSETVNQTQQTDTTIDESQENLIDITKPMIALTFDDGPSAHTQRLLDIFKTHGGKGTFFVLGSTLDDRQEALRQIANDGHEIGNHSWNHRQLTNLSEEEITDQIMMTRAKIYDTVGVDSLIMRPPYGACDDTVKEVGAKVGVSFVNWSVDTLDWKNKDASNEGRTEEQRNADLKRIADEVINNAARGDIVLMHDIYSCSVDAFCLA